MASVRLAVAFAILGFLLASLAGSPADAAEQTRDFIRAGPDQARDAGPAAADQGLGMALMSADVSSVGALLGGAGAVSATRLEIGAYRVTFVRSVETCTPVATVGSSEFNTAYFAAQTSANRRNFSDAPNPEDISVYTRTNTGTNFDFGFHLIVFCAK